MFFFSISFFILVSVTVQQYYEMDYRIREPPYITADYMELYHKV